MQSPAQFNNMFAKISDFLNLIFKVICNMIYKHKLKDFMITGTYFFSEIKTNVSSGKFILLINKRDKIERKDHKSFLNCGSLKKCLLSAT